MYRRSFVLIALVTLGSAALVSVATPVSAFPAAHGTANCSMLAGGSGQVTPGLTPAGVPGAMHIKFVDQLVATSPGGCGAVTSPVGTHLVGGTVQAVGSYVPVPVTGRANKCASFTTSDKVNSLTVTITWSATPHIAQTTIVYTGNTGTVTVSGNHDLITLNAPPGTATKSGSFAFPAAGLPHKVQLLTTLPAPGPLCSAGPYSSFKIRSGSVSM